MISTDFAPNESWDDAILSLKLLFQPWKWMRGNDIEQVKRKLLSKLLITNNKYRISLFLSGRSALYFLLKSLNLPKGSEVLVQAFTCEAVVLPIVELGMKPIYVDIEADTYSMDYRFLTSKPGNKLTKVLILQHTFGLTPKYRNKILNLTKERKLIVIEDLAHGFNKSIFSPNNQYLISNNFFLLSFGRSKTLSSVFGGAIATPQSTINNLPMPSTWFIFQCLLYKPLTMLIKSTYDIYLGKILHKVLNKLNLLIPEITKKEKKGIYDRLFNKAYPNALAILLLHQLNKFEQIKQQRAKICQIYNQHFPNFILPSSKPASIPKQQSSNFSLIRYPLLTERRDKILVKVNKQNVYLGKWYDEVVAPKDLDQSRVEYEQGSCPNAEKVCKNIINLPTNITEEQAKRVLKILNDVK
ncbi:hypothetical protein A2954_04255 [Candidatus Roizmanbacteria bacterium RIFCSPLOWO2_01_FULL_37_12]|uniref:DegT/DnrJ/EryC1/StrS aminotransferase n=1 Tax=Candidatus Roizmanbacteria bacterium RIFCSPLOWO2_01_FULL_37_12 TaxID=1802056 RepID=A0A1F7IFQ4_9BACT|nr:MAG: hypothetical protein A3D76_06165 [Candidatus Roizmanbacteria bacterium RIFCSPHIGHO2_02_FULL_37_9b]OGK42196.1 MAG: hypothetical protein A2954_04255 [Candidatus Roizmanbacteria bacterium RIFCSPLOWO2_01_FULL_37_12]